MRLIPPALLAAIVSLVFGGQALAEVRVNGATTVAYGLIKPQLAEIEEITGEQIALLPSSTSRGLADLAERKADIAMLAEPLVSAVAALQVKDATIQTADLIVT